MLCYAENRFFVNILKEEIYAHTGIKRLKDRLKKREAMSGHQRKKSFLKN